VSVRARECVHVGVCAWMRACARDQAKELWETANKCEVEIAELFRQVCTSFVSRGLEEDYGSACVACSGLSRGLDCMPAGSRRVVLMSP
jgi:hypothetical protein